MRLKKGLLHDIIKSAFCLGMRQRIICGEDEVWEMRIYKGRVL